MYRRAKFFACPAATAPTETLGFKPGLEPLEAAVVITATSWLSMKYWLTDELFDFGETNIVNLLKKSPGPAVVEAIPVFT